jgi:hypothetical protein
MTALQQGDRSDADLLAGFHAHRDEASFDVLVRRHGPMVFGVCRRLLGHEQEAEDAYQATFLVLARRAGQIRRPERLASWLWGVAAGHANNRGRPCMSPRHRPGPTIPAISETSSTRN